ncbi:MAG: hypothetical protein ACKOA8_04760 [Deltaproteobacteria bacterium]
MAVSDVHSLALVVVADVADRFLDVESLEGVVSKYPGFCEMG